MDDDRIEELASLEDSMEGSAETTVDLGCDDPWCPCLLCEWDRQYVARLAERTAA